LGNVSGGAKVTAKMIMLYVFWECPKFYKMDKHDVRSFSSCVNGLAEEMTVSYNVFCFAGNVSLQCENQNNTAASNVF